MTLKEIKLEFPLPCICQLSSTETEVQGFDTYKGPSVLSWNSAAFNMDCRLRNTKLWTPLEFAQGPYSDSKRPSGLDSSNNLQGFP